MRRDSPVVLFQSPVAADDGEQGNDIVADGDTLSGRSGEGKVPRPRDPRRTPVGSAPRDPRCTPGAPAALAAPVVSPSTNKQARGAFGWSVLPAAKRAKKAPQDA